MFLIQVNTPYEKESNYEKSYYHSEKRGACVKIKEASWDKYRCEGIRNISENPVELPEASVYIDEVEQHSFNKLKSLLNPLIEEPFRTAFINHGLFISLKLNPRGEVLALSYTMNTKHGIPKDLFWDKVADIIRKKIYFKLHFNSSGINLEDGCITQTLLISFQ